jgi:DNA-cytosine methyltransferase
MGINVLSLFDGISCGRLALERAGIKVGKYYASEIDKYAIKVSEKNWPNIIQLGDIAKWREWNIPKPDLIIGGSPCQGFSFAGGRLNFADPRSILFMGFADILKHYKPKNFLLENVFMDKASNDVISSTLGEIYPECVTQNEMFRSGRLEPILINSALVSAQNRNRLYWTNISNIQQPKDKGILLKDILENGLPAQAVKYGKIVTRHNAPKGCCCCATDYKGLRNLKQSSISIVGYADIKGHDLIHRVYGIDGKAPTLTAVCGGQQQEKITQDGLYYRQLTPLEYERLQTLPDGYTDCVSKTRRYHAIGNGWTVDVVAHIFKNLNNAKLAGGL